MWRSTADTGPIVLEVEILIPVLDGGEASRLPVPSLYRQAEPQIGDGDHRRGPGEADGHYTPGGRRRPPRWRRRGPLRAGGCTHGAPPVPPVRRAVGGSSDRRSSTPAAGDPPLEPRRRLEPDASGPRSSRHTSCCHGLPRLADEPSSLGCGPVHGRPCALPAATVGSPLHLNAGADIGTQLF